MNALALTHPAAESSEFKPVHLPVFAEVPAGCDVVPLMGKVIIYHEDWSELLDGEVYVVENQRPVGGMSWDTFDRFNRERGSAEPRVRIRAERRVIQAVRDRKRADSWWFVHASGFRDGPIADWSTGYSVIGKAVAVYRPEPHREPS